MWKQLAFLLFSTSSSCCPVNHNLTWKARKALFCCCANNLNIWIVFDTRPVCNKPPPEERAIILWLLKKYFSAEEIVYWDPMDGHVKCNMKWRGHVLCYAGLLCVCVPPEADVVSVKLWSWPKREQSSVWSVNARLTQLISSISRLSSKPVRVSLSMLRAKVASSLRIVVVASSTATTHSNSILLLMLPCLWPNFFAHCFLLLDQIKVQTLLTCLWTGPLDWKVTTTERRLKVVLRPPLAALFSTHPWENVKLRLAQLPIALSFNIKANAMIHLVVVASNFFPRLERKAKLS